MRRNFLLCLLSLFALAASGASPAASPLPVAKPEQVGLSSERLKRVHEMIERYRERGDIAGAVTVVTRRGKLAHFEAQGLSDIEASKPMRTDDIMRIASMTKLIATVGALMLLEEQRFLLEDPVSKYLPEFRDMKVALGREGDPGYKLVAAEREITIHDLLSHRSGLQRGAGQIRSLPEFTKAVAAAPLLFQPGAGWNYGPSTDVVGRLIEVISGKTLGEFLRARLFTPLGMTDTYFALPKEKLARLASLYRKNAGKLEKATTPPNLLEPRFESASGGLMSTAPDYTRFTQMLVNGGELDGRRYLSRKTIELMTERSWPAIPLSFLRGQYFGLGVAVRDETPESGVLGSPGTYGWSGAHNTYFRIDPKEQLVLILFVQIAPGNDMGLQYGFQNTVMQAIAD